MTRKKKGLPRDAARKLVESISKYSGTKGFQRHQWVETFVRAVRELAHHPKAAWPWGSILWIRLNGVLDELDGTFRFLHDARTAAGRPPIEGTLGWHAERVFEAIQAVRATLTEDEIIFVHYCRTMNAHVAAGGYYLQGHMGRPDLLETLAVPALRKSLPRDTLLQRVEAVMGRYPNLNVAAADFAQKVAKPAIELYKAHAALKKVDEDTSAARGRFIDVLVEESMAERFGKKPGDDS